MLSRFENRREAGKFLAAKLRSYKGRSDVVVLALPRGGVPVAYEVAKELGAPLEVFIVRKLGVPGQEELALGAIASGGERFIQDDLVRALGITQPMIERIAERESIELKRREKEYRGSRPELDVKGKIVIVVDDGLATGSTMLVAVNALKRLSPRLIVIAAPVGSRYTCSQFSKLIDGLCVCVMTPEPFYGVGAWYRDFSQTTDDEVRDLLNRANPEQKSRIAA